MRAVSQDFILLETDGGIQIGHPCFFRVRKSRVQIGLSHGRGADPTRHQHDPHGKSSSTS